MSSKNSRKVVEDSFQTRSSWPRRRFSTAFSFSRGLDIKKRDLVDEGIPVVSYGQIHSKANTSVRLDEVLIRFADPASLTAEQVAKATLRKGDIVFADTSEDVAGAGNFVRYDELNSVCAGYHTLIARPEAGFDHPYYAYQMLSPAWKQQIHRQVQGVKVFSVTQRMLHQVYLLDPPLEDRDRIVAHLERQSKAIDATVTVLNEQLALLDQYKRQMISDAVCHGVQGEENTRSSGVDWIGDIPESWSTIRARYLFEIVKRIEPGFSGEVLSITQRGIVPKDLESNFGQLAESYEKYQRVDVGDFAMNTMDLLTGWVDRSKYPGITSPDYRVFRLRPEIDADPRYYTHVLQMGYTRRIFYKFGQGVSNLGRWRLQPRVFLNMRFPLPPLAEQEAIAEFIDSRVEEIAALRTDIGRQIELLEEYRMQMINDVVTGRTRVSEDAE